jgi:hypothetical protein
MVSTCKPYWCRVQYWTGKADGDVETQGSTINLDDIKRFEVTEVYTHPDAKADIVFVHGLNGEPRRSWTGKNGTYWPTQLLPDSLKSSQARILTYGYNADVWTFGSGGKSPRYAHLVVRFRYGQTANFCKL